MTAPGEGSTVNPALLTLLAFAAAALAVAGVYSILSDLFLRDRSRISQRVDEEFRKRQRERAKKSSLFKNLGTLATEVGPGETTSLRQRFEELVEQSGLDLTPRRLLMYMAAGGLFCAALAVFFRPNLIAILGAALIAAAAPVLYVSFKRKQRLDKLMSQLPDAFDLMARVIRAGQTMAQAIQGVADEFDQPIAAEFAYCYEQQNLGLSMELALRDLGRRTGLLEIKIFVLALLVQQQTGGNLAEMLEKLAGVMRERFKIRGKIKALTAEGRMQAGVLLALPPGLFLLMLFLNRAYGQVLLDHPMILIGMLVSEFLGALWIRKIVNFDF
jgi:tight adherence protein B